MKRLENLRNLLAAEMISEYRSERYIADLQQSIAELERALWASAICAAIADERLINALSR